MSYKWNLWGVWLLGLLLSLAFGKHPLLLHLSVAGFFVSYGWVTICCPAGLFHFCHPVAEGVPGQGSDPSCSLSLSRSCGNIRSRSLTHCPGPGIEPACQCSQDATDPFAPLRELPSGFFTDLIPQLFSLFHSNILVQLVLWDLLQDYD